MPEAYAILDAFEWTPEQMGEVMLMNQEDGSDPYENAKQWVEENQDVVEQWRGQSWIGRELLKQRGVAAGDFYFEVEPPRKRGGARFRVTRQSTAAPGS